MKQNFFGGQITQCLISYKHNKGTYFHTATHQMFNTNEKPN